MKKSILSILSVALLLVSCGNDPVYVPGEKSNIAQNNIFFPVSEERGLELDPEENITSHTVTIGRLDASAALNVPLKVTVNTDGVFSVPESVDFAAGDNQTTFTFNFANMQIGSTYTLRLEIDGSLYNPYKHDTLLTGEQLIPFYEYQATLIKYEPAEGIFYDDIITGYAGLDRVAWTVTYETATLPSGVKKMRIINPYHSIATAVDEDGVYNGCPFNDAENLLEEGDYNIYLTIKDNKATLETSYLGIDYGYGPMYVVHYDAAQAGELIDTLGVVFSLDDQILVCGDDDGLYNYAGFNLYFTKEAYLKDTYVEPAEAAVEDYEGDFLLVGIDFDTEEETAIPVNIKSYEDEEDGQYYEITGISEDVPVVYATFKDDTHYMAIEASMGEELVTDTGTYQAYFYPIDSEGYLNGRKTIDFIATEEGLELVETSECAAFSLYYENVDDEDDYFFGFGLDEIGFVKAEASAPQKAKGRQGKPMTHKRQYQTVSKTLSLKRVSK